MEKIRLDSLTPHPDNPRKITDDALEILKGKIGAFEKMLTVRPIVYDEDRIIWGGNQRHLVLGLLGYEEIPAEWTKEIIGWSLEDKKRFALTDNISDGTWDRDALEGDYWNDFDFGNLGDDILKFIKEAESFSDEGFFQNDDKPKDQDDPISRIVLEYSHDDAEIVRNELKKHGKTPEQAVHKLLGL